MRLGVEAPRSRESGDVSALIRRYWLQLLFFWVLSLVFLSV